MKKFYLNKLFFLFAFLFLLTGCVHNPDDYILKTEKQILEYMNENFCAEFKVTGKKIEDSGDVSKEITVTLTSDLTGEKEITVKHGFANGYMFSIDEYFETDFYSVLYSKNGEQRIEEIYKENLLPFYAYRNFYFIDSNRMINCSIIYENFDDYFYKASNLGYLITVVKAARNIEDPKQDELFYSFCAKLKKLNNFSKEILFDAEVDLDNLTEENARLLIDEKYEIESEDLIIF